MTFTTFDLGGHVQGEIFEMGKSLPYFIIYMERLLLHVAFSKGDLILKNKSQFSHLPHGVSTAIIDPMCNSKPALMEPLKLKYLAY